MARFTTTFTTEEGKVAPFFAEFCLFHRNRRIPETRIKSAYFSIGGTSMSIIKILMTCHGTTRCVGLVRRINWGSKK